MYISRILVRNFRNFRHFDIALDDGVTCLVGENNTGKTNLLFAVRLCLDASLSSIYRRLRSEDFFSGVDYTEPAQVLISLEFRDFQDSENEGALLQGWEIGDDLARITYRYRPSSRVQAAIESGEHSGGGLVLEEDYRWQLVGGDRGCDPGTVEWNENLGTAVRMDELHQAFLVRYLEPLRDVERRLGQHRYSPLTHLLAQADIPDDERGAILETLRSANEVIASQDSIERLGTSINDQLHDTVGRAFALGARLGLAPPSFNDVSRALEVLLSDDSLRDYHPRLNGLGMNNVLYISMILQHFENRVAEAQTAGQLLVIEEPEAHLHPQLQRVLYTTLRKKPFQTLITTHSSHISSQAPLDSVVTLTRGAQHGTASFTTRGDAETSDSYRADLERYLDATRSTLLFARSVLLVEGPSELFLVPELVRSVLKTDLDKEGVTILPIYGKHFSAYASLFGPGRIEKRCAVLADGDSSADAEADEGTNSEPLYQLRNSFVEVFLCDQTFEREITNAGSLEMFALAAEELGATRTAVVLRSLEEGFRTSDDQQAQSLLRSRAGGVVLKTAKRFGKARFAQVASRFADNASWVPSYIREAVEWLSP